MMSANRMFFPPPYEHVLGVDFCDDNYIRVAFLGSAGCSPTEDLHRYRDLRAFDRRWWRRHENFGFIAAAITLDSNNPEKAKWFSERHIAFHVIQPNQMQPFLEEARELEVPRRYRRAHALARCAAIRIGATSFVKQLDARFDELVLALHDAQADLRKYTAANYWYNDDA